MRLLESIYKMITYTFDRRIVKFKACVLYLFIFCQKIFMIFISSKKLFSFSRYSTFCNFYLPFHNFHNQRIRWNWNNYEAVNWLDCELWIQKPFCTKSSKLPTCYTTKTETFLNMFGKPKRDWYLVPGPFFQSLVHKKGLDAKENINLTLQRLLDNPLF